MSKKNVIVSNVSEGHDNPIAELVQVACQFDSDIMLESDNRRINAKSIMGIMAFNPSDGMSVDIVTEGADEEAALDAIEAGDAFFEYDGATYELTTTEKETSTEVVKDGEVYATVSNLLVSPQAKGVFLSLSFKEAVEQAIADKASTFTAVNEAGEEETYQLQTKNTQYVVRSQKATTVNDTYSGPSKKHWLGTDGNGMDMLTRLMYGGCCNLYSGNAAVHYHRFCYGLLQN